MRIAYLTNQYPKVSHSFIRREILGIEAAGHTVIRHTIRSCSSELIDPEDISELEKTEVVLDTGISGLINHGFRAFISSPLRWLQALNLALKLSSVSNRSTAYHIAYLLEACKLLHRFSQTKVDHIHVHFGTNPTAVAMLCNALGGPSYSFTVHGPEEFDQPIALALGEKVKQANFVVAISSFGKSQLYRWSDPKDWPKVHIVHCGVDQSFLDQNISATVSSSTQADGKKNENVLVCVGRLSEQKGHLVLLEAVRELAQKGLLFKVIFVGDGPLKALLQLKIEQWKLEDYIEITGWVSGDEVRSYILRAKALVLPSFAEGLPVVIMEALALRRPVISTYVAGIPELLTPECGWLVPASDSKALVLAMLEALQAPIEQLNKMGRIGAQKVAQRHNAYNEAAKLSALFESSTE